MQLKHSNDEAITFPGRKVVIGGNVAVEAVAICDDCRMTYSTLEYKKICPIAGENPLTWQRGKN
ncbi:MAG: hypothetical protein LBS02_11105 [Hungatella sp.]|nr:hypothetical protein [Hungatella sp.]